MRPEGWQDTERLIRMALAEDQADADATSGLLSESVAGRAVIVAREAGVLAGIGVALAVFRRVDASLEASPALPDGARFERGQHLGVVEGALASILRAERPALNFLQRLCGIATSVRAYADAVEGTGAAFIDTRKTLPGWRLLDKYAVRMGGGRNHRMSLADGVLIKDNHIAAAARDGRALGYLVERARASAPHTVRVEVECDTLAQVREAVEAGADVVMLDNMSLAEMREGVALSRGKALTEASGGVTLETVRAVAETGVDFVSSGAVTHSVRALDVSLDVELG